MRIISFVTQKGGTGKSTLAFNVAVAAAEAGETVALFDLDPQGMLTVWGKRREGLAELAEEAKDTARVATLSNPQVQHITPAELPAFRKQLKELTGFSLVILDTKGEDSPAQRMAIQAADFNIVVMRPSRADVDMSLPTLETLTDTKVNGVTKPWASALTQCPAIPNNNRAPEVALALRMLGKLLEPLVWNRTEYQDAYAEGLGVTERNPKGKAAEEMRAMWKSIDRATKGMK